ncbi:hypothetical protein PVAG01_03074 [Phlyctema vagabunda]|uniref:FAD-binding FR-type domain-containing protein n=1 Tax=Phlyctema vagabunda TaxID=108571 RepID=A0ABR4PSH9_9HELO
MDSEWLRSAIRFSMTATITTSRLDDAPGPPQQRDPRFRKLVEGILYSRSFVLTYHLVVLGLICIVSSIHWTGRAIRWRRRRTARLQVLRVDDAYDGDADIINTFNGIQTKQVAADSSSSGSSTLVGTASPPHKGVNATEVTPLLHDGHALQPLYPRRTVLSHVQAFLMYQPQPIPVFDKTLPSNGTSLLLLSFIGLNIFYALHRINFNFFELFVLADRFGLVFVVNLPLLYLFAAKTQPLKVLTGQSYESLNIFHRRLGELMCLEALFHALGMLGVWYTLLRPTGFTFARFLLSKVIVLGLLAFFAYELLYFTSLGSFRQRWYEVFLALHVFLQIAALVFVFFHHAGSGIYVGLALAIFTVDRIVYRTCLKSTTVQAEVVVLRDEETVKLSTNIAIQPSSALARVFRRSIPGGWQATDHVFISIPSLGRKYILQAHPFTVASAAPMPGDEEAKLELLIRAQDGFSAALLEQAYYQKIMAVRLDGPYGSAHARDSLVEADLSIVVAGGSGIAVAWPLVQHLLNVSRSTDTEIAPTSMLLRQKIVLVWVVHKAEQSSWLDERDITAAEDKGLELILPLPTEEVGRPNLPKIINELVDNYGGQVSRKIAVVASGPDGMGRNVRNTCARLRRDGRDINVLIEKFGW